jgi:hypothetical protein
VLLVRARALRRRLLGRLLCLLHLRRTPPDSDDETADGGRHRQHAGDDISYGDAARATAVSCRQPRRRAGSTTQNATSSASRRACCRTASTRRDAGCTAGHHRAAGPGPGRSAETHRAGATALRAALQQVFKIANDDVVLVPIFWPSSAMAINRKYKLTGYTAFWYNVPWAIRGFGKR